MGEKDQKQEIEIETLEAEISDLEERLSDESEDDTASTPKAKATKKFSLRDIASSVISKLKLAPKPKVNSCFSKQGLRPYFLAFFEKCSQP